MKFVDLMITAPMWTAYARALYNRMLYPHAVVSTWCHQPARCRLRHRLVAVQPPGKPTRFGFKHIEV